MLECSQNILLCNSTNSGIYGLRCKTTNKWYVGQSVDIAARWSKYKNLNCRRQPKLYNALLKYGYDDFEKIILESNLAGVEELNAREVYWSNQYNSVSNGYNSREPGGQRGRLSDETKKKISIANKRNPPSAKCIEKAVEANRGKRLSNDRIERMIEAGKKWVMEFPEHPFTIDDVCDKYPEIPYTTIAVRIRTAEKRGELRLHSEKQKAWRRSRKIYSVNSTKGNVCTGQE